MNGQPVAEAELVEEDVVAVVVTAYCQESSSVIGTHGEAT